MTQWFWRRAPILVFRNEVGTQLNCKAAIHNATQSGYTPIVCVAQDTCKDKPIEDPTFMKKLLEISDSKTEQLPGLLPFVPGMSAILTQNIAIELGFINGINGIFRQLVYQSDSISTDVLSQAFPSNTQYVHRPLNALSEIARSKVECNLEELQPKLVPIPLMEQTFRVDITDILPKGQCPFHPHQATRNNAFDPKKRTDLPKRVLDIVLSNLSVFTTINNYEIYLKTRPASTMLLYNSFELASKTIICKSFPKTMSKCSHDQYRKETTTNKQEAEKEQHKTALSVETKETLSLYAADPYLQDNNSMNNMMTLGSPLSQPLKFDTTE
ncbi:unnamed protein product [Rotaria socialis]|uniref:Uncharacterized protein n=1 Tax=Rotaria socialis TaxID=392032 RepID=A0A820Y144_9BILA|nr:unnamed protein product [Rotaria socialis]